MPSRQRTTDKLTAFGKEYMRQMAQLKSRPYVKNGILQDQFSQAKQEGKGKKTKASLGDVAVYNEFGTADGRVPERSFIRSTWDAHANNKATWGGLADDLKKQVNAGKMTIATALARMGARIKADTQEKIRSMIPPPNAPSTLAKKFPKSKTLINTGQLLNGLDYQVTLRYEP